MFDWIKTNWDGIDEAVMAIIAFFEKLLTKFAEWPIIDVEI